ncbi:MAG: M28 family peptidase [Flavobacteriaceae bacterium]
MRYIILIFLSAWLVGCGASRLRQTTNTSPDSPEGVKGGIAIPAEEKASEVAMNVKPNTFLSAENFSDNTRISGIMNFLASDDLEGRDAGSEGIEKAADFIEGIFEQNNIKPYFSTYKDTLSNFSKPAYNIVGVVAGNDKDLAGEYIIVGAHYDHIGIIEPQNGDAIANGANDNASGTSTVLELARFFGNARTNKRSLLFVLFSAEEKGLLGAKHLANKLKAEEMDLYTMLNFEMTGVPLADKDYFMYVTGYSQSNLAEISNKYAKENLIGFLPTAKEFNLFQRSDNYPFHQVFNVPSQTYCTFDFTNFNHYHKVGDETSEMDFEHMAKVVNKMIPVIEGIANSPDKEIKYY